MASIIKEPNGRRTIQFSAKTADGAVRRSVRLGKATQRTAEVVKRHIEAILACQFSGSSLDSTTAEWLGDIDDTLHARLVAVGLTTARTKHHTISVTLGQFIDAYIALRGDIKPGTKTNYLQTRRWLVEYFGEDRPLDTITPGDVDELRSYFVKEKLGENTLRRHLKRAGQFFRHAERKKIIPENPFAGLKGLAVRGNREKFYFITQEQAQKVLAACPDTQWKLLFALSRYGGLRCPSEHLALTWKDVDWEKNRLTVRSPKTEHHEGKASRIIPLFPELKGILERAFDEAEAGAIHVIARHRDCKVNLRTHLIRIIHRAGLKPWPKLFHNLRATRQTELAQSFPQHVVCDWMGNSTDVGQEHYLRTLDADFERAAITPTMPTINPVQNPVQNDTETSRNTTQTKNASPSEGEAFLVVASSCTTVQNDKVTLGRFEPPF
ncbi:MAG TPA: tyrosine-type recombinase/integrase [Gemmatales bacterium]|nr:tyrosine-type recombinase/integrase [Gemmatales bacterium]